MQCSWEIKVWQGDSVKRLDIKDIWTIGDRNLKVEVISEDMIGHSHKIILGHQSHKIAETSPKNVPNHNPDMECMHKLNQEVKDNLQNHRQEEEKDQKKLLYVLHVPAALVRPWGSK